MKPHRAGPQQKSAKVVFKTPGRECSHADRGCCPKCLDPMALKGNMTFRLGRQLFNGSSKAQ